MKKVTFCTGKEERERESEREREMTVLFVWELAAWIIVSCCLVDFYHTIRREAISP